VSFTFSYVNSDALAMVISALLFYHLVLLFKNKIKIAYRNSITLGVLVGLGMLTRYNLFIVLPFFVFAYVFNLLNDKNSNLVKLKNLFLLTFTAVIISGWWYLRNLILYGELLGTRNFWQTVHMLHPPKDIGKSFYTPFFILFKTGWLWQNFKSFWASFGWNYIFLPEFYYRILLLLMLWAGYGLIKYCSQNNKGRQLIGLSLALIFSSILLSLWQSWKWAFQAQGRYFFPVLLTVGYLIISGIIALNKSENFQKLITISLCLLIIFLNIFSLLTIIPSYY
jgi:4-amino-4-deoxy-L-arabinose transferase-like glycosyltransferase